MEATDIIHYLTIKDYAKDKSIDWRTAKKRLSLGKIVCFLFRKKKVYIELSELQKLLLSKLS